MWKLPKVLLPLLICAAVTASILSVFFLRVDLKPQVDENFFFSSEDPQFKADKMISEIFPQPPQFVIGARGDIQSREYIAKIQALSDELAMLEEVFSVQSLTHGPDDLEDARESPLWKRVLISEDGEASFLSVFIEDVPAEEIVPKIEAVRDRFNGPDFELMVSGAPYIVELIRRNLADDLKVFSLAAFVIFGIVLFLVFRSFGILLGMLVSCLNASALTLIITDLLQIHVGPLTANLSTMVFVLTLSPMVFITFNWRKVVGEGDTRKEEARREALRRTFGGSFWSMATTFVGFGSLIFVAATPLKQLGISGALGTLVAFCSAYLIYPWFLDLEEEVKRGLEEISIKIPLEALKRRQTVLMLAFGVLAVLSALGLRKVNMDPDLLSYFKKGSELREGLEYIDRNGGSSPLKLVVSDQLEEKFNTGEAYRRLLKLHEAIENVPAVGSAVSLPIILAEAKRSPLTFLISTEWLLKLMETPRFGEIAKYFVTEDRKMAFYLLRMKEMGRTGPRTEIVNYLEDLIIEEGFVPQLTGGAYLLQGKMSQLLTSSLISGVLILITLFVIMGWGLSRSFPISFAMLMGLAMIPLVMLGILGHLRIPLDLISSPAANLAIGMGVDSMIYMVFFAGRGIKKGAEPWKAWVRARRELWKPILCNMAVITAGFGIFLVSHFPPTQRFGFSVVLGSILAPLASLFILPYFAIQFEKTVKAVS